MSTSPDQAPAIAEYLHCAQVPELFGNLAPWAAHLSDESKIHHIADRLAVHFPRASIEEFTRGVSIANAVLDADQADRYHSDAAANPCACGQPGLLVLVDADHVPTGKRNCFECSVIEAAKTPCISCGGPMNGEDVCAGITLCDDCDPDEIGWTDDGGAK